MMTVRIIVLASAIVAASLAGACSSISGLTTGSTAAGTKPPPPQAKPTDRAISAAALSARAEKCGYNFDPARLRASFIETEVAQGLAAADAAALERLYDVTRASVAGRIRPDADYCTDGKTAEIKSDLQRHLAGDFSVRSKPSEEGLLAAWTSPSRGPEKLNPEWMRNQQWEPRTRSSSSDE